MKLKDLLFNREKLREYDELEYWKGYFSRGIIISKVETGSIFQNDVKRLPENIQKIIVSALDAAIEKINETEI